MHIANNLPNKTCHTEQATTVRSDIIVFREKCTAQLLKCGLVAERQVSAERPIFSIRRPDVACCSCCFKYKMDQLRRRAAFNSKKQLSASPHRPLMALSQQTPDSQMQPWSSPPHACQSPTWHETMPFNVAASTDCFVDTVCYYISFITDLPVDSSTQAATILREGSGSKLPYYGSRLCDNI